MSKLLALLVLSAAAALEAGGDAAVRAGLHAPGAARRVLLIAAGGAALTAYGVVVNLPPWDFGRLLGVYVCLFFATAQVVNAAVFGVAPTLPILVGGALITGGGLLMTFWR